MTLGRCAAIAAWLCVALGSQGTAQVPEADVAVPLVTRERISALAPALREEWSTYVELHGLEPRHEQMDHQ